MNSKFGVKTSAFLKERTRKYGLAVRTLEGSAMHLDAENLGSATELLASGVDRRRILVINYKKDVCAPAKALGLQAFVRRFDQCADLVSSRDVRIVYYDGTRGDPEHAWNDMRDVVRAMKPDEPNYLSVTVTKRSSSGIPQTAKFPLLLQLWSEGFEPAGGWRNLPEVFTKDDKVYNVQMVRCVCEPLAESMGIVDAGGFELGASSLRIKREAKKSYEQVRLKLRKHLLQFRRRPHPMCSSTNPEVPPWEALRRDIENLGRRKAKRLLQEFAGKWVVRAYEEAKEQCRAKTLRRQALDPKLRAEVEDSYWQLVRPWYEEALDGEGPVAVALERHPEPGRFLGRLLEVLPKDRRRDTLVSGESDLSSGIKSAVTKGLHHPLRCSRALAASPYLRRFPEKFSILVVPILSAESYEDATELLRGLLQFAKVSSTLALSLKTEAPATTLAWAVTIVGWLAAEYGYEPCKLRVDEALYKDVSGVVTVFLER